MLTFAESFAALSTDEQSFEILARKDELPKETGEFKQ